MSNFRTLHTDIWEISLPADWKQGQSTDESLYFESGDGTKGIYVTVWKLGPQDRREAQEVADAIRENDIGALKRMQGYDWQHVTGSDDVEGGTCVAITDMLAIERSYRSVGKILATPPLVVRASFHDYGCTDYALSRDYFAVLIDSFRFYQPDPEQADGPLH